MCYQPDPEETQRVVTPIPAVYKRAGYWGVTHVPTDVVWETMEVLQAHVAAWRLPSDETPEQGRASQRLLAATAELLAHRP